MGLVIRLSMKESIQHTMIVQYLAGQVELEAACQRLNLHRTTFWRKCVRYQEQGPAGLIHGLREKPSNSAKNHALKTEILKIYTEQYQPYGFNTAHFYEQALKSFPQPVGYSTVLRWLKSSGLVQNSRKGWKHHTRRPRREAFGEMLQMDTSIHDWLGWGKNLALISNMDDATSRICGAYLTLSDTTLGNMTVIKQTIRSYGLFAALYVDRAPVFKVTRTGGFGRINQPTYQATYITQIQRALDELGIELIFAYSPQAKGRIERSFSTWQSRLIPELRKNGIIDLAKANAYIQEVFVPQHSTLCHRSQKSTFGFCPALQRQSRSHFGGKIPAHCF